MRTIYILTSLGPVFGDFSDICQYLVLAKYLASNDNAYLSLYNILQEVRPQMNEQLFNSMYRVFGPIFNQACLTTSEEERDSSGSCGDGVKYYGINNEENMWSHCISFEKDLKLFLQNYDQIDKIDQEINILYQIESTRTQVEELIAERETLKSSRVLSEWDCIQISILKI